MQSRFRAESYEEKVRNKGGEILQECIKKLDNRMNNNEQDIFRGRVLFRARYNMRNVESSLKRRHWEVMEQTLMNKLDWTRFVGWKRSGFELLARLRYKIGERDQLK